MRDAYAIRTPENVAFEFELAGITARAVALLMDYVVMGALMLAAIVAALALGVVAGGVRRPSTSWPHSWCSGATGRCANGASTGRRLASESWASA